LWGTLFQGGELCSNPMPGYVAREANGQNVRLPAGKRGRGFLAGADGGSDLADRHQRREVAGTVEARRRNESGVAPAGIGGVEAQCADSLGLDERSGESVVTITQGAPPGGWTVSD